MRRLLVTTLAVATLVGVLAVAVSMYLTTAPTLPMSGAAIVVREGDGVAEIGRRLEAAGVVRSALIFRLWARYADRDRVIQPGTYRFEAATEIPHILARLADGVPPIEITIPEGLSVREIATLLAARGIGTVEDVRCLAADADFLATTGVPGPQLEGFLFPDTYRFAPTVSASEVLETMVHRFHERFDADRWARASVRQLTVNQVVTLASIVEKETGKPDERPVIAAVFANRLRLGMPLQSDPTVIYGIPDFDGDLRRADLTRPSPYNTYVIPGLPPGPIANPGLAAIDAVLAPADSPALYFVSRNDGSHEFSTTLTEHNRAVARYQRRVSH